MRRAPVLGLAALAIASFTLTACEKPSPGVTAFSGTSSVRTDALCWAFDSDRLDPGQCAQEILTGQPVDGVPVLNVAPGNTVGISVDEAVAEAGWSPVISGNRVSQTPLTETYFRFSVPQSPTELGTAPIPLQIVAGSDGAVRGVWTILLQPRPE